jgi:hypothetical protein
MLWFSESESSVVVELICAISGLKNSRGTDTDAGGPQREGRGLRGFREDVSAAVLSSSLRMCLMILPKVPLVLPLTVAPTFRSLSRFPMAMDNLISQIVERLRGQLDMEMLLEKYRVRSFTYGKRKETPQSEPSELEMETKLFWKLALLKPKREKKERREHGCK